MRWFTKRGAHHQSFNTAILFGGGVFREEDMAHISVHVEKYCDNERILTGQSTRTSEFSANQGSRDCKKSQLVSPESTPATRCEQNASKLEWRWTGWQGSCCWLWKGLLNRRGSLMWPFSLQVLLLTLCYCSKVSSDDQLNLIHARLLNMLKTKQSLFYRRNLRTDPGMDLREHRVFHSDPKLDCCPTLTEFEPRRTGINPSGLVLELFSSPNFTQSFYETICHPSLRNRPCQFIDPRISYATRCVQQFSYVYAIGRTYGSNEVFRVDYIRIPAGCKCQVRQKLLRRRKKSVILQ